MSLIIKERALLCNFEDDIILSELSPILQNIWKGNWDELLKSDTCSNLLNQTESEFQTFVQNCDDREEIFCHGIASLLTFIQSNYTGPPLNENLTDYLNEKKFDDVLIIEDEEVNVNVTHSKLLNLSKRIFEYCRLENEFINNWWCLRYILIHQNLLDECSQILFNKAEGLIEKLSQCKFGDACLESTLLLEISQLHLLFGRVNDSEKSINTAKELLGVTFELSGEMGKRTKYQDKQVAQMILKVNASGENEATKSYIVPEIVKLDDDVRLDHIKYENQQEVPKLTVLEQLLLLTTLQLMQRSRPKDALLLEESQAFLSFILQQNNTWPFRVVALLLRCRLESNHKRTIERSLMQCESIVADLKRTEPINVDRVRHFWCIAMSPKWITESVMADLMLNLGMVKSSLECYLNLHLWEEVVVCYTMLQMRHNAAEVIRQQLAIKETVKLWCMLGDATDDVNCYKTAWELSESKSARAQRHWGQYFFSRKDYAACIPHLQKSLEINSLQNMVWLRLAYAALEVEDWKLSSSCYRRYTSFEPGSFEAWNNLAKAYIKLGEKKRAHFALQEALKYSFNNWKVWDNFMVVSADIAYFDDVVRSYHNILDVKEKHLDLEVLLVLVRHAVTLDENNRLKTKTRELFGRLGSIYPNESQLWEYYSDLAPTAELRVQRLFRAYRGLVQGDWSKDPAQADKVLDICVRLGRESLQADVSTLSNARMTVRGVVSACKKQNWEQNVEKLIELEKILEDILQKSIKPS